VNTVSFNSNGKGYASGAEDGYCRLHVFPKSYFLDAKKLTSKVNRSRSFVLSLFFWLCAVGVFVCVVLFACLPGRCDPAAAWRQFAVERCAWSGMADGSIFFVCVAAVRAVCAAAFVILCVALLLCPLCRCSLENARQTNNPSNTNTPHTHTHTTHTHMHTVMQKQ
jgi:hypothetical protein